MVPYANKHKGVCVGFDLHPYFSWRPDGVRSYSVNDQTLYWLGVDYDIRNNLIIDENMEYGLGGEDFYDAFRKKYKCWEHENEERLLLSTSNRVYVPVPASSIKEVIFGLSLSKEDEELVAASIKDDAELRIRLGRCRIDLEKQTIGIEYQ